MIYTQHALSAYFDPMSEGEFQSLRDSIESIGVQNPITVYEGQVIDGWHRYRVCTELAMDCPTVPLAEGVDPRDYVLAQNRARRSTTPAQMALTVTRVYAWHPVGANQHRGLAGPASPAPKTIKQMADMAGVSERSIGQAKVITKNGSDAVKQAIATGKLGLEKAAAIAKMPPAKQAAAIDKPLPKKAKPDQPAKPAPEEQGGADGPGAAELAADALAQEADLQAMQALLDASDTLATAYAEIKRLNAEVAQLKVARDGYMTELKEYKKITAKVQRENDRLRKNK